MGTPGKCGNISEPGDNIRRNEMKLDETTDQIVLEKDGGWGT